VLDHDTNVIFTLPGGGGSNNLYQIDLSSIKAAAGSSLAWESLSAPTFSTTGYEAVMAEASNHISEIERKWKR
jgi:hypothetical protein